MLPRPGDIVLVGARASVQFAGDRAVRLRVIAVCDRPTYAGWAWITGYVLDDAGRAVQRRQLFVQPAGLRRLPPTRHVDGRLTRSSGDTS